MPLPIADYGRVAGLAAITGMRHLSGLAFVGYAASRGRLENLEGTRLSWLRSRTLSHALVVAALGELVVDKLPFLPGRNTWPLITQRAGMGALVGSALGVSAKRSAGPFAALGAFIGGISSWSAYHLRTGATRNFGIPDLIAGLIEDVLVVSGGLGIVGHMASRPREVAGSGPASGLTTSAESADAETKQRADYDYVVVGSGAGGGPLACNLAKAGHRVLLLEAGGDHENYNYQVPVFHGLATEDEDLKWDYYVRHYADDERQHRDTKFVEQRDGVLYPRSGTLGGCTAHNAMITVYPQNGDWDRIAQITGDASWRSQNMRKYFERLERCQYIGRPRAYPKNPFLASILRWIPGLSKLFGNPGRHGFDGWLSTNVANPSLVIRDDQLLRVIKAAAKGALVDLLGRPLRIWEDWDTYFDPNDARAQETDLQGLWFTPLATNKGHRNGTREYIKEVRSRLPHNLTVKTNALATKVLFDDDDKAIGIEYLEGEHLYRADPRAGQRSDRPAASRAFVEKEIILSAGAFNTPQLLKLSGVGPGEELVELGIEVRVDLPGVGENLQDRYEVGIVTEMKSEFALLENCAFKPPLPGQEPDPCFEEWQSGKGVYTTNGVSLAIIEKSRRASEPDLFIFGLPGYFRGYYPKYSEEVERERNRFTWAILKAHTRNTAGQVKLKSDNPRDVPHINFHYFEEGSDTSGEDLDAVADGVEFARRIMDRASEVVEKELVPGKGVRTREQIKEFVKNEGWGHHASCTCKMGPKDDPMAVVDSNFRVHGTANLRVVDASVFPRIPGFFIVSAVYMVSEKASEVILAGAPARPGVLRRMFGRVARRGT
jgi:choline dehydrogenase